MKAREEIWQNIGQIIVNYRLLECTPCAIAIVQWLSDNGTQGQILRLRTKRPSELFIISQRHGMSESITENGIHYGVEVFGKVFDNLSTEGLSRVEWINDFSCASGQLLLEELTSL